MDWVTITLNISYTSSSVIINVYGIIRLYGPEPWNFTMVFLLLSNSFGYNFLFSSVNETICNIFPFSNFFFRDSAIIINMQTRVHIKIRSILNYMARINSGPVLLFMLSNLTLRFLIMII